ncbi:putative RNA binding protein [Leishmania major strain Friedlin]|uniref:Putative RNA binding protein n=1 Tax=Leishmania major TaxID=5664 RepID=E9ADZ8_LEIMA|nr:putative RNA binding protein [Leishmania major strain Friedlin]CAG9577876.1 RNA_binding_protein_-_putative [Leishmania major strain Friedlin]CBZ12477.1 putative RNA binding protein [Leishmania major strain Friedlin]|eukprot:XP_003722219.1 putative RNA binding protein [Leishmania major strain Friedlin]
MPQMTENICSVQGAGNTAPQADSPCHSVSSALPATNGLVSNDLTNSSFSEHPLSESSGGVLAQPQISGNVADFQNFLDEPSNWEWAVNALSVEPGHSDRNIFVSKLPPTFKDADLQELFENFGPVVSAKVMLNVKTGISKETGFVKFTSYKDALRARAFFRLRLASSPTTPAMPEVVTQWAQNKHDGGLYGERCQQVRKLFIRNVPARITQADMRVFVSQFGNVSDVSVHSDTYDAPPASPPGRGRRLKQMSPSEGTEGEEAEASRPGPGPEEHETIICFVTFAEAGAAMRACREIHNTTPFDSCNGVPLMAKLAEDNSSRHARRHHGASVAKAVPASWGACAPLCDGSSTYSSAYSSEAHTPLTCTVGYHRISHPSQVSVSQHQQQQYSAASNCVMQPPPPPTLSASYVNTDLSPVHRSHPSTPQYPSQSAQHASFGIPAPRRTFQQRSAAMSPASAVPPAAVITPSSPSILSTTMSPTAPQQPHSTRTRHVPLPPALSMEATESGLANVAIPTTTTSTPSSPPHAADVYAHTPLRIGRETPVQTPRRRQSPPSATQMGNYLSDAYTAVHTPYTGHQHQQRRLPMNHGDVQGAYHANGDFYQEYSYSDPMELNMHPISSSASSEAVHEYGNTGGAELSAYRACDNQRDVAPLWQRRMERHIATTVCSAAVAALAGVPHLSPCAAYGAPLAYASAEGALSMGAAMQPEVCETTSSPQTKSAVPSPYVLYPPAVVVNSGSRTKTPRSGVSGSVRYRNNPYSMRLVRTVALDSSPCVDS